MNHERSHSGDRTSSHPKKSIIATRSRNRMEYAELRASPPSVNRFTNNHQIISFHQFLWFWLQQSSWFNFSHGLFWGVVFGFTAATSATFGVALTKVDTVERAIIRTIERYTPQASSEVSSLSRSIDVLAIAIEPNSDEAVEFSQTLTGESKTILLLKFQPDVDKVRVINIPIDSRVKIPGLGWGTLADANRYGGTALVSQLVVKLLGDTTIDRHIYLSSQTFEQLISSGKIKLDDCDLAIKDCSNLSEQIQRQQITLEVIRQRLNIPTYISNFKSSFIELQSDLDTNLSVAEVMSIANFLKELDAEKIAVDLPDRYTPGKTIDVSDRLAQSSGLEGKSSPNRFKTNQQSSLSGLAEQTTKSSMSQTSENISIAVQNTTETPELGMRLVSYLRSQNFQDVYLVEHIPLRLNKTRIVINQNQIAKAKHLKNILGLGGLEQKLSTIPQPLTIQIGEDALDLPLNNRIDESIK